MRAIALNGAASTKEQKILWAFWLLMVAAVLFWGNGSVSLWDEDEAAYALFGKTMLESGDWLVPDFSWSDIHRKTPFHFWAIGASFALFGVNEWALRLPTVLALCWLMWLMWFWGAELWGRRVAAWSLLILMSSLMMPTLAKVALTDGWLLLTSAAAALALMLAMETETEDRARRALLYFWLWVGVGILVKGPPIVILAGGMWWVALLTHERGRARLLSWGAVLGAAWAILPFSLWAGAVWYSGRGDFLQFLYDWYVVKRVGGSVLGQTGWAGYHFVVLSLSFLPMLVAVWSSAGECRRWWQARRGLVCLGLGWLGFGWWFFELMSSKLPTYSLSVQPLWAVAGAAMWSLWAKQAQSAEKGDFWRSLPALVRGAWWLWLLVWWSVVAAALLLPMVENVPSWVASIVDDWRVRLWLLLLGGAATAAVVAMRRGEVGAALIASTLLGLGLQWGAWALVAPQIENSPMKSLRRIAERVLQERKAGETVALVGFTPSQTKPSLLFYLVQNEKMSDKSARSRVFEQITSEEALSRAWTYPEKRQLFLAGEKEGDWVRNIRDNFPQARIDTLHWWSTDDQLRAHDFYFVRNF